MLLSGAGYVFRHSLLPSDHTAGSHAEAPAELPMAVTVVRAEPRMISRSIVAGGTLVAREEVLIVARLESVPVGRVLVDVGDLVTEGQPLALLDGQRLELLLAQKSADRVRAEAVIAQAEALSAEAGAAEQEATFALERAAALRERGNVSAQALQEREAAAAIAAARAEAQRQELAAARADLLRVGAERDELMWERDRATVRATATGIVIERTARVGQTTAADGTPLFRILRDGEVEMEASVIETALTAIRAGQGATVAVAGLESPIRGQVRLVSPSVDPATRMGKVWISLRGTGMRPGGSASVTFEADRREAIVVPRAAVLAGDAGSRVQVVQDGVVVLREVEAGLADASGVEIRAGLEEGEIVIAAAGGFLREGSLVSPVFGRAASAEGDFR